MFKAHHLQKESYWKDFLNNRVFKLLLKVSTVRAFRIAHRRLFHKVGPETAKARLPYLTVFTLGTCRRPLLSDRKVLLGIYGTSMS